MLLELIETARFIVDTIANKLGADIVLLDLSGITLIADYFIIATGDSDRQLDAIAREVHERLQVDHRMAPLAIEGTGQSGWILMDYGSIVVHLFSPAQRNRYQLESFWNKARVIVRMA